MFESDRPPHLQRAILCRKHATDVLGFGVPAGGGTLHHANAVTLDNRLM